MVEAMLVAEELGRMLHPAPWAATAVGAASLLDALEPTDDVCGLRAGVAGGSIVATVALPPPAESGEPTAGIRVDGTGRATGTVPQVLGAPVADVVLLVGEDASGESITVFTFEPAAAPGAIRATPAIDRTVTTGALALAETDVVELGHVPAGAVDGARDHLLIALAADALGAASASLDLAVTYAKERHQFGQPIGAFQAVQHLCVDMFETVELVRGGVIRAACAADAGDPAERHLATMRLRASADRLVTVAETAIQVFGGIGYTWEHDAHLYLKRLMTWATFMGSPRAYRVALGRALSTVPEGRT
jgi:alkylation response protein AidB-like acyl-CoA dehydrogenase